MGETTHQRSVALLLFVGLLAFLNCSSPVISLVIEPNQQQHQPYYYHPGYQQQLLLQQKLPTAINGRVVGGTNAATNSAPFIASMQYNGKHYCAVNIIKTNWCVTAAHCLSSKQQVLSSIIVAGSTNVAGTATTTQKRSIAKYIVHDLYNGGTAPYDIGLVYTSTAFEWTAAVKAIALPSSTAAPTGTADLYGWGSTSTTSVPSYPSQLQVAKSIPIITLQSCEKALGSKGSDLHTTNLCTGPLTGKIGICTSDSGGPLVQQKSSATELIGIVSWGKLPCGQTDSPSVYAQVSLFTAWINKMAI